MQIGIAGHGVVGAALARFFRRGGNSIAVYDKYVEEHSSAAAFDALQRCDLVFVAVPTPFDAARGVGDASAVRELVDRLNVPLCIKSTVPPGTIDSLIATTGKPIAYSPEYMGESPQHPYREVDAAGFVICAGSPIACRLVRRAYETCPPATLRFIETTPATAELVKYMENAFLATKVSFVNQFYDLAVAANVDFEELRAVFLMDPRAGESHTEVHPDRGFAGKCLPKDLETLVGWARGRVNADFLTSLLAYNRVIRARAASPSSGPQAASSCDGEASSHADPSARDEVRRGEALGAGGI
jgi:UDPglucose 6-dehydrogenase